MSNQELSLVQRVAKRFNLGTTDKEKVLDILRNTAFPQGKKSSPLSNAELFTALVLVDSYGLDPFAKQITAFRSDGRLQVVITIDGWAQIISRSPRVKGLDAEIVYYEERPERFKDVRVERIPEYVIVTMDLDGWEKPLRIIERFEECYRNTVPWNTMTSRLMRHKGISQAGRLGLGVAAMDPDEAREIGFTDVVDAEVEESKDKDPAAAIEQDEKSVVVEMPDKAMEPEEVKKAVDKSKDTSWM